MLRLNSPGSTTVDPRRWKALAVLLLASSMNLVDVTIVSVAMPSIQDHLHAGAAQTEWIVAAYSLVFALGLITGGRLGDLAGRRRVFAIGVAGFVLASLVCGVAPSAELLIAGRVLQGVFAAAMVPQVLATIHVLFDEEERGKAFGLWGATMGLATVGSPLLGAALLHLDLFGWDWRTIFLVNAPLGAVALAGAVLWVPESRSEHPLRLDLPGIGLLTVALLALMYPLVQGHSLGWPAWTFAAMAAGVALLGLFAVQQRRLGDDGSPLVPMGLFRFRGFTAGVLLGLVFFSGIVGFSLTLQLTLQEGLGFSPIHGALTVLPFSLAIAAASPAAMALGPRLGRTLLLGGALLMAVGSAALMIAVRAQGADLGSLALLPGMVLCGLAVGAVAMRAGGQEARSTVLTWVACAVLLTAAVVAGRLLAGPLSDETLSLALAFAGGAVLASLADTLMPEAYEQGGPTVALSTTAGFVLSFFLSTL